MWYSPTACDDTCCESPCEPPLVNCHKLDSYYGGTFEYSITDADVAWIGEICGETTTIHPITLVDGNATGSFSTNDTCRYCVTARKGDCETFCCDTCNTPVCYIDSVVAQTDRSVVVTWRYFWSANIFQGDPVTTATINGVDVLQGEIFGSGTLTYAREDVPDTIAFYLANDCGREATCVFDTPCCWGKDQVRVTITAADLSRSCDYTWPEPYSPTAATWMTRLRRTTTWSGLSALSGTYLFDIVNNQCGRDTSSEYYIGEVDASWDEIVNFRGFYNSPTPGGSGFRDEEWHNTLSITGIKLYLRANAIFAEFPTTATFVCSGQATVDPSDPAAPYYQFSAVVALKQTRVQIGVLDTSPNDSLKCPTYETVGRINSGDPTWVTGPVANGVHNGIWAAQPNYNTLAWGESTNNPGADECTARIKDDITFDVEYELLQ